MQVLENQRRGRVDGVSVDYLAYSLLGYIAYAAFTWALLFDGAAQAAYASAHGGEASDVQLAGVPARTPGRGAGRGGGRWMNGQGSRGASASAARADACCCRGWVGEGGGPRAAGSRLPFAHAPPCSSSARRRPPARPPADFLFAAHATLATGVTMAQYATFNAPALLARERRQPQSLSRSCKALLGCVAVASAALLLQVRAACEDAGGMDCHSWLTLLSWLGGVKVRCASAHDPAAVDRRPP